MIITQPFRTLALHAVGHARITAELNQANDTAFLLHRQKHIERAITLLQSRMTDILTGYAEGDLIAEGDLDKALSAISCLHGPVIYLQIKSAARERVYTILSDRLTEKLAAE